MPRSYTVEHQGAVIPFEAPDDASPEQLKTLAARALRAARPSVPFQRPVLEKRITDQPQRLADQGSISAAPDTLESRINSKITGALDWLGLNEGHAQRLADKATSALDDLTPVGSVLEADRAKQSYGQGDYLGAAGHGALAALGLVPEGGKVGAGVLHSIIAPLWHGSPHKFEKFALEKIGTGEGAQAYGHGLYFAENPEVAKEYAANVKNMAPIRDANTRMAEIAKQLNGLEIPGRYGHYRTPEGYQLKAEYDALMDQRSQVSNAPGHLYEVKLDANPEDFLDYDAPIADQPRALDALKALDLENLDGVYSRTRSMLKFVRDNKELPEYRTKGRELLNAVSQYGENRAAEHGALMPFGIKGVQYFDQGSRSAGQGTRNYVVYDPSIIDILGRY